MLRGLSKLGEVRGVLRGLSKFGEMYAWLDAGEGGGSIGILCGPHARGPTVDSYGPPQPEASQEYMGRKFKTSFIRPMLSTWKSWPICRSTTLVFPTPWDPSNTTLAEWKISGVGEAIGIH